MCDHLKEEVLNDTVIKEEITDEHEFEKGNEKRNQTIRTMQKLEFKGHSDQCDEKFNNRTTLNSHKRYEHATGELFECSFVKEEVQIEGQESISSFDEKPFKCSQCSKVFRTPANLNKHTAMAHKISKVKDHEKNYQCDQCAKAFKNKQLLYIHIRYLHATDRPFQCHLCPKSYAIVSFLNAHIKTHSAEKRYKCDLCSKCYKTGFGLAFHKANAHNIGGKFRCETCGKGFVTRSGCKQHQMSHRWGKNFTCDECGKHFRNKRVLINHKAYVHPSIKPFQCEMCSNGYTTLQGLKYHSVKHQEKITKTTKGGIVGHDYSRKFFCEHCRRIFFVSSELEEHLVWHNEEKNFSCDQCDKKFRQKNNLDIHKHYAHATGPKSQQHDETKRKIQVRKEDKAEMGSMDLDPITFDEVDVKVEPVVLYDPEMEQVVVDETKGVVIKQEPGVDENCSNEENSDS